MRLSELLAALPGVAARAGEADPYISLVTADSRRVVPGALFVAVRGDHFDGHDFIPQAIQKGAVAIVAESPRTPTLTHSHTYVIVPDSRAALAWLSAAWRGFPARKLVMIGVTGTDGKTTTATLIHSILLAAGLKAGLISTVSAVVGDETLDTGFHVTTPEAPEVQGYLGRMVAAGLTHCVLEVTSHGLAQQRVAGCEFDIAVVTNITHEHLDYHKTYENYRAAKAALFSGLSAAAPKPGVQKTGVLNADDSSFDYLRGVLTERSLSYGLNSPADVTAHDIRHAPEGIHFNASFPQSFNPQPPASNLPPPASHLLITSPLVGDYNLSNCLAAIAATVCALGLPPEAAQRGITAVKGVPGRMERIDLGQPFTAIVDFAHTPNALRRALETARQMIASQRPERSGAQGSELETTRQMIADERPERSGAKRSAVEGRASVSEAPSTALRSAQGASSAGRVIAVFGSAGLRDVEKRRLMAETSAELADITVLTAEDPRTESLDAILEMMAASAARAGGVEGRTLFRIPDRGEAIRFAVGLARPGDAVLACGKGHEQSMCFGATEYPWDDRTAMRAALADLLSAPGPEMPRLPASRPLNR